MPSQITLNQSQQLYVIPCGDGYSCFSFKNTALHTIQMVFQLTAFERNRTSNDPAPSAFEHPLAWQDSDYGQLTGYEKYQKVLALWAKSPASSQTYFEPGTDPKVKQLLERYRKSRTSVRLFFGDTETGRDWMSEYDVFGTIGRSCGPQKVPLLVSDGDFGGGAILTSCVLRIIEVDSLKEVYVHPLYQAPNLSVHPDTKTRGYRFRVDRDDDVQARFRSLEQAHAYVAFMLGCAVHVRSIH
jgi:hypothetical protein